ncbi:hypothetical protein T4B_10843 [Trichinella pseudospiralis]|uniref:Uncharacterized protein n=1 Tax=Trichinella pseudospiralis TaxID=6337 RepID=A0A0V1EF22_TRIPS|nr:hypothetical protein T4A_10369 [Trichinella pseudospiralis]KRZ24529.1 hypothetical protein T4B_10843 [Trichinella pseudospiralis]KRZ31069.1 hypothetical protein T4C_5917 [Trichinella pseudospiralis]
MFLLYGRSVFSVYEQSLTKCVTIAISILLTGKDIHPLAIDVFKSSSLLRTRQAFGPQASASDKTAGRGFKYSIAKQLFLRGHVSLHFQSTAIDSMRLMASKLIHIVKIPLRQI